MITYLYYFEIIKNYIPIESLYNFLNNSKFDKEEKGIVHECFIKLKVLCIEEIFKIAEENWLKECNNKVKMKLRKICYYEKIINLKWFYNDICILPCIDIADKKLKEIRSVNDWVILDSNFKEQNFINKIDDSFDYIQYQYQVPKISSKTTEKIATEKDNNIQYLLERINNNLNYIATK